MNGTHGMSANQPNTYTPIESLLLFQSLLTHGVDAPAFDRVSEILKNNPLIKSGITYNPARLSPDALQHLFLEQWREELKVEFERSVANDTTLDPEARKRRLENPPLPTLRDTYDHIYKLPQLIDRLWQKYRNQTIDELRDEEKHFRQVQHEVKLLERNETQRLAKLAQSQDASQISQSGSPSSAPGDLKTNVTNTGARGSTQTPSPVATAAAPRRTTSTTPVFPPRHLAGQASPPGTLPPQQTAQGHRPTNSPQLHAASGGTLQSQSGAASPASQSLQRPPHIPRPSISPRPDTSSKPNAPVSAGQAVCPKPVANPAQAQQQYHQQQRQQQPHQQPRLQPAPSPAHKPVQPRPAQSASPHLPPSHPHTPQGGQSAPQAHHTPQRTAAAGQAPQQPPTRPTSTTPILPPTRPAQLPHNPAQVPRPIAVASPVAAVPKTVATPQSKPVTQPPNTAASQYQHTPQQGTHPVPSATHASSQGPQRPHVVAHPKPAIPEHMIRAAATPNAARRASASAHAMSPSTPVAQTPSTIKSGFGTKWAPQSTPSTPGPLVREPESPAYEPVSPPARGTELPPREPMKLTLPPEIAGKVNDKMRTARTSSATKSRSLRARRSQSVASQTDEISIGHTESDRPIKDEAITPRPREETGDTTADESIQGRRMSVATPNSVSSRVPKRKRRDTSPEPQIKQTHVMWTRGFTKVSSSVLDRISSHRDANMFANPLRERDAPGYSGVVLQPQDFTSIRAAIKNGNKAAISAANSLPGGDPGTPNVWLPISEDLLPPKAIINSAQLDRELVHMFCNAIMYNPDPYRGPGPAFLKSPEDGGGKLIGYRLDEDGIVTNTQAMFLEVENLLGDLRSAEKARAGPGGPSTTRPTSVAHTPAAEDTADDEDELAADTEATSGSGTIKRRRLAARG